MTIETITDLTLDYMYDSLGESNNSIDGKEIQYIQEKQNKRNWSDNPATKDQKRTVKNQSTKITGADNAGHPTGQECTFAQQKRRML